MSKKEKICYVICYENTLLSVVCVVNAQQSSEFLKISYGFTTVTCGTHLKL